jgi:hypothetical protein
MKPTLDCSIGEKITRNGVAVAQTVSETDLKEAGFFPDGSDEEEALARTNADYSRNTFGATAAKSVRRASCLHIF